MPGTMTGDGDSSRRTLMLPDLELVLEQREHVGDDRVEVHRMSVPSRPYPAGDSVSRPLTIFAARNVCFSIFSSSTVLGSAGVGAVEQHLREARNAGERRVHLVRDAGRQEADRRHLLGDLQLLLEVDAIGDVLEQENHPGHVGRAAGLSLQRNRRGVDQQLRRASSSAPSSPDRERRVSGTRNSVAPYGFSRQAARSASTNGWSNTSGRRRPIALVRGHAVEAFERPVPPDDPLVHVAHHQAIVERFEDVLVELAHAAELFGLEVQLPVQPAVLDGGRHLAGDRGQQREVLAVERLVVVLAPQRQDGDRAAFEHARDEVVDRVVAPELDFLGRETARRRSDRRARPCGRRRAAAAATSRAPAAAPDRRIRNRRWRRTRPTARRPASAPCDRRRASRRCGRRGAG